MRNEKGQFIKGSSGFTGKHSEKTKRKIGIANSIANKGKKKPPRSEEHSKKLSEALRGNTIWLGKKHKKSTIEKYKLVRRLKPTNWKGGLSSKYRAKHAPRPKPDQCEICGAFGEICFDHDHMTNKFRGWICKRCNFVLGMVKDSQDLLIKLSKYLYEKNN